MKALKLSLIIYAYLVAEIAGIANPHPAHIIEYVLESVLVVNERALPIILLY